MAKKSLSFRNFTDIPDKKAKPVLERLREVVIKGEQDRQNRVEKAERHHDFWLNKIWTDSDLQFFNDLDITPYEFPVQRSLINNLISRQRQGKVDFEFIPTDIHSYKRHRKGREKYVEKYGDRHETREKAEEFYDKYGDDQYSQAITTMLHNTRNENGAKHVESETFQDGVVTGLDFFKAVYSRKHNDEGGIEITHRPQRAVFFDETSVEYTLSDIEFIGETHLLYKTQLISEYPNKKDEIEEIFEEFTNLDQRSFTPTDSSNWKYYYNFDPSSRDTEDKAKVVELWFLDTEERLLVVDQETGEKRLVKHDVTEEDLADKLMAVVLADLKEQAKTDPKIDEIINSEDAKQRIAQISEERYDVQTTHKNVWYKAVFTYNVLFELKRSPLPHGSHPYFPFFAQYSEGDFVGLMDDIEDVIISINKALAVRELMMAHGAKNLVIVDENALAKSDYDITDIADQWTSIGAVVALKPMEGKGIADIIQSISTVGEGLPAINEILADLDNRLYQISGVNLAQLGITERETTATGFRQQIMEGQQNNGLIFDNFMRSMEEFYSKKVVPLIVWLMRNKGQKVIRSLSDEFKPWIEIDYGEDFDLFEKAIYSGQYSLDLRQKQADKQIQEQRSAKYMELAAAGMIPIEVALEFSPDPERYKIIKRIKEVRMEQQQEFQANQVSVQQVMQIAMELGVSADVAQDIVKQLQKEKAKEIEQTQQQLRPPQGSPQQQGQGLSTVRESANQPQKTEGIERTITNQEQ